MPNIFHWYKNKNIKIQFDTGLGEVAGAADDDDDEVPDLVENFDEASKDEKATEDAKITEEAEGNCY